MKKELILLSLKKTYNKRILLIPNPNFEYPRYEITVSYSNAPKAQDSEKKSYELIKSVEASYSPSISNKQQEAPIITNTILARPVQMPKKKDTGLLSKIWSYFKTTEQHSSKSIRSSSKNHSSSDRDRDERYNRNKKAQHGNPAKQGEYQKNTKKRQYPKKNQRRPQNKVYANINEKALENQSIHKHEHKHEQKHEQHVAKPSKEHENIIVNPQEVKNIIQPIEQSKKVEKKVTKVDVTKNEQPKKTSKPKNKRIRKSLSGDMGTLETTDSKNTKKKDFIEKEVESANASIAISENKDKALKKDSNQGNQNNNIKFVVEAETTPGFNELPGDNIGNLKSHDDANRDTTDTEKDDSKFKKKHFSKNKKHQKKNFYKNTKTKSVQKPKTRITD